MIVYMAYLSYRYEGDDAKDVTLHTHEWMADYKAFMMASYDLMDNFNPAKWRFGEWQHPRYASYGCVRRVEIVP